MKRVTGIGGIFFKCSSPEDMRKWYKEHLGIESDQYGGLFKWRLHDEPETEGTTTWSPFSSETKYFEPSQKDFMLNYRVEDLVSLIDILKKEGVTVVGEMQEFEYGKFAWIMDPDGNKIELWEPVDEVFTNNQDNS